MFPHVLIILLTNQMSVTWSQNLTCRLEAMVTWALCVLFPLQTIKHLRTAEFKPFVVFVKPPSIERLKETRRNAKVISGKDDKGNAKPFTVRGAERFFTQNPQQALINIICCLFILQPEAPDESGFLSFRQSQEINILVSKKPFSHLKCQLVLPHCLIFVNSVQIRLS